MSVVKNLKAALNWQMVLAAFFILLPTVLGFYHGVQGRIVIADPEMSDQNFSKTVLYMFDHQWYSAKALVVNRGYKDIENIPAYLRGRHFPVYWGGPVEDKDRVFILDLIPEEWDIPIVLKFDEIVKENPDILQQVEKNPERYRVFVGYTGWGFLQFETEKESGGWKVAPYLSFIFDNKLSPNDLWDEVLKYSDDKKKPHILERQKS